MLQTYNHKTPDYVGEFAARQKALDEIRANPKLLAALRTYYRDNPWDFISDWGVTVEPRNAEIGMPTIIPFVLVPRQVEWCKWLVERWHAREPGLTEKSRDMGVSWLTVAISATLCLFYDNLSIGYSNRKREYIDSLGNPKAFFTRLRAFMTHLPREFVGSWDVTKHAPFARMLFPDNGSTIIGESGKDAGRGDRVAIHMSDELAFNPYQDSLDAALSQTTNCRIDISTPNGNNNAFYRRRTSGKISVFSFHWRDNPLKDEEWYRKKCDELDDPVLIAQELDLDYNASTEGGIIQSAWVQAAIDAHEKLGIKAEGARLAGFDVADIGKDHNALAIRTGIVLDTLVDWSGRESDIYATVAKAINLCDEHSCCEVLYDADGLGASVRGDARSLLYDRKNIDFHPFRGSGAVITPEGCPFTGARLAPRGNRTNADFFANYKAQSWWSLRRRFNRTFQAVTQGKHVAPEDIISISSKLPQLSKLLAELTQPTYTANTTGKIVIDKAPDGARSPNLADAVMICYAPTKRPRGFFYA